MMAKKSDRKQQKRLSAERIIKTGRKESTWIVKTSPGAHPKALSVPLSFVLRDLLKIAGRMGEAKTVLNSGSVKVNGVVRRSGRFAVGLLDILSLEKEGKQHFYRILLDGKGRISAVEAPDAKDGVGICKVKDKRTIAGGINQVTTEGSLVLRNAEPSIKVNDSLMVRYPDNKILGVLEMKKGNSAYIISGKNAGTTAKIKDITEGTVKREKIVTLDSDGRKLMTLISKVVVVGKGKPEIDLGVGE
jgi:small subunit ribosomal protein S4e